MKHFMVVLVERSGHRKSENLENSSNRIHLFQDWYGKGPLKSMLSLSEDSAALISFSGLVLKNGFYFRTSGIWEGHFLKYHAFSESKNRVPWFLKQQTVWQHVKWIICKTLGWVRLSCRTFNLSLLQESYICVRGHPPTYFVY